MKSEQSITENSKVSLVILWTVIIGCVGIMGFLYSIKSDVAAASAHADANTAALKQTITENYETQAAHRTDMDSMSAWNKSIAQSQKDLSDKVDKNNVEQRLAIQHVSDKMDTLKPSN